MVMSIYEKIAHNKELSQQYQAGKIAYETYVSSWKDISNSEIQNEQRRLSRRRTGKLSLESQRLGGIYKVLPISRNLAQEVSKPIIVEQPKQISQPTQVPSYFSFDTKQPQSIAPVSKTPSYFSFAPDIKQDKIFYSPDKKFKGIESTKLQQSVLLPPSEQKRLDIEVTKRGEQGKPIELYDYGVGEKLTAPVGYYYSEQEISMQKPIREKQFFTSIEQYEIGKQQEIKRKERAEQFLMNPELMAEQEKTWKKYNKEYALRKGIKESEERVEQFKYNIYGGYTESGGLYKKESDNLFVKSFKATATLPLDLFIDVPVVAGRMAYFTKKAYLSPYEERTQFAKDFVSAQKDLTKQFFSVENIPNLAAMGVWGLYGYLGSKQPKLVGQEYVGEGVKTYPRESVLEPLRISETGKVKTTFDIGGDIREITTPTKFDISATRIGIKQKTVLSPITTAEYNILDRYFATGKQQVGKSTGSVFSDIKITEKGSIFEGTLIPKGAKEGTAAIYGENILDRIKPTKVYTAAETYSLKKGLNLETGGVMSEFYIEQPQKIIETPFYTETKPQTITTFRQPQYSLTTGKAESFSFAYDRATVSSEIDLSLQKIYFGEPKQPIKQSAFISLIPKETKNVLYIEPTETARIKGFKTTKQGGLTFLEQIEKPPKIVEPINIKKQLYASSVTSLEQQAATRALSQLKKPTLYASPMLPLRETVSQVKKEKIIAIAEPKLKYSFDTIGLSKYKTDLVTKTDTKTLLSLDVPSLKLTQRATQRTELTPALFIDTATKTDVLPMQKLELKSDLKTRQEYKLKTDFKTIPFGFTPPTITPFVPSMPPSITIPSAAKGTRYGIGTRRKYSYAPSLIGAELNLAITKTSGFTGFEARGTGYAKAKKQKKPKKLRRSTKKVYKRLRK